MNEWLNRVDLSLKEALEVAERGDVPLENLYMLATTLYSKEKHTNNESLLKEISEFNEQQVAADCSVDPRSRSQYKFHYVSAYLGCYFVAGKIDESKYERILDYVTQNMELFSSDYEPW